ncbi:putative ribosomal N-acetyltransferase YdaF [Rhodobacteraceae bacterium SB2]|jgi:ribosomal-protein-alanine N-acetyltransferase|nr:N-acetyltransferase [Marinovum sp.]MBT4230819.1 GNAT family N-acetyltransferase [Paracoccaceae bacterium]OAH07384.1 putative ribosomal N-acetyltransferase YdaF [Rhodobacteraceae bacterium SB2]WQC61723.1 GNAT family protein [Alphaproteobacteria bacterium US3C007]MBF20607.1 N-acetyltransferase [Marinovum sp.]|tara:strand:- start:2198 stop:2782 length:585 start_codon:yes stop_codon:yes gene_type:complete
MLFKRRSVSILTARLSLRLPEHRDFREWAKLRHQSRAFLSPWEPIWAADHLSRASFTNRVYWSQRAVKNGNAVPLFVFHKEAGQLVGAITLDNIRRGPSQVGTIGYWVGQQYARQGFMSEAIIAMVAHAFGALDLSRVESACLPDNVASRGVLEKAGFKYEGVAQSYIQINGRWRNHVLYAALRGDRRGRSSAG